jgi:hypothetical protein
MEKERYDIIIENLTALPQEEKLPYLKSVIEETDCDENSWNGELIHMYNKFAKSNADKFNS